MKMPIADHERPIDPERVAHARSRLPNVDDAARLTGLLSMMADPVRLRLIYALDVVEELCVGDLALALEVSEDSVSYALRLLRTAGLVLTLVNPMITISGNYVDNAAIEWTNEHEANAAAHSSP